MPSVLYFIQLWIGGCQITSIIGVLLWWVSILKAFKITKSKIIGPFVGFTRLPDREAWVVIIAIIAFLASLGFFLLQKSWIIESDYFYKTT